MVRLNFWAEGTDLDLQVFDTNKSSSKAHIKQPHDHPEKTIKKCNVARQSLVQQCSSQSAPYDRLGLAK